MFRSHTPFPLFEPGKWKVFTTDSSSICNCWTQHCLKVHLPHTANGQKPTTGESQGETLKKLQQHKDEKQYEKRKKVCTDLIKSTTQHNTKQNATKSKVNQSRSQVQKNSLKQDPSYSTKDHIPFDTSNHEVYFYHQQP